MGERLENQLSRNPEQRARYADFIRATAHGQQAGPSITVKFGPAAGPMPSPMTRDSVDPRPTHLRHFQVQRISVLGLEQRAEFDTAL